MAIGWLGKSRYLICVIKTSYSFLSITIYFHRNTEGFSCTPASMVLFEDFIFHVSTQFTKEGTSFELSTPPILLSPDPFYLLEDCKHLQYILFTKMTCLTTVNEVNKRDICVLFPALAAATFQLSLCQVNHYW